MARERKQSGLWLATGKNPQFPPLLGCLVESFTLEVRQPDRSTDMPRVIITVPEKNAQPYRFSLDRKSVSIGRGSDNDIVIDSGSVSSKHAEMRRIEGGYELGDLGSTNGIKHRGVRHDRITLETGMSLRLGDVSFDFTLSDDELDTITREKPAERMRPAAHAPAETNLEEQAPKPIRQPISPPLPAPQPAGVSAGMIVFFLLLAAAAFVTGLSIRHQKDTGESLIKAIINKPVPEEKTAE
jgi:pSer/pThr/pTyr-binding forkhead associated (FHA) protein